MAKAQIKPGGELRPFELVSFLPHRLSTLSRLTQKLLAAALAESGMTIAQWRVYLCLASRGPCHLNGIAEFTHLPQSSLSRSIAQMDARGLVRNARDENDRRIARIELTSKGRKYLGELTATIQASCEAAFQMSPAERAKFLKTLDTLIGLLSEWLEEHE